MRRQLLFLGCPFLVVLVLAGCSKAGSPASTAGSTEGPIKVAVVATKTGCVPSPTTVAAGPLTFDVSTEAGAITEIELQKGSRILGEKENLIPGLSGSFSLRLPAGTYTVYCPGADTEKTPLVVTAAS